MATNYQFGLSGIAADVILGKSGAHMNYDGTDINLFKSDGSTLINLNIADPTAASHAVTKNYVDSVAQGLDVKKSVRAVATTNITLSGTQTIDGVTLVAGDRVLVNGQTNAADNGIYVVAAGAWSRATDADSSAKLNAGAFTFVEEGTTYADTGFVLSTNDTITLGTTALTFTQFSSAGVVQAGTGLSKSGTTLNMNTGTTIATDGSNVPIVNSSATANQILLSAGTVGTEATFGALPLGDTNAVTGLLGQANGGLGTDISAYAAESLIIANAGTVTEHPIGTNGNALIVSAGAVAWGQIDLADATNAVTGVLAATNGGTGLSSYTQGDIIVATAANTLSALPLGTANQILISNGTDVAWSNPLPVSNSVMSISAPIVFSGGATQLIGTLPAGAIVVSVDMDITTAFDTGTFSVGSTTPNTYMATTENDPTIAALFTSKLHTTEATAATVNATLTGAPTAGAGTVTVYYIQP